VLVEIRVVVTRKLVHAAIGSRIAQVRQRLGLKRYEFAKILGVSPATAGNYERGQMPRADLVGEIARAGGVTVEWLLHGTEAKGRATTSMTHASDLEPRFVWPDIAPRALLRLPPAYLQRYQVRLKQQITRLRRELGEYRRVLRLEYRTESARRKHDASERRG